MERFRNVEYHASSLKDAYDIVTNALLERFIKIINDPNHYKEYVIDDVFECFKLLQSSKALDAVSLCNKMISKRSASWRNCYIYIRESDDVVPETTINKLLSKADKLFNNYYKKEIFK